MLCNDYRHASAPARSKSVQVDFTGLAIIRPHRSLRHRVRQCTPEVSGAMISRDPRWGRNSRVLLLNSSSKRRIPNDPVGLGLAGHGCLAPSSVLEHMTRAGGRWDALTDLRSERQLKSEISLTEVAITTPLAISPNSKILD